MSLLQILWFLLQPKNMHVKAHWRLFTAFRYECESEESEGSNRMDGCKSSKSCFINIAYTNIYTQKSVSAARLSVCSVSQCPKTNDIRCFKKPERKEADYSITHITSPERG